MKKSLVKQPGQAALVLCLLFAVQCMAAQFVELSAEIRTLHWLDMGTNRMPTVQANFWTTRCVVSTNAWLIETEVFPARHAWWFTGSNVTAHSVITDYPSERKELFAKNHPDVVIGRGYTTVFDFADGQPVSAPAILVGELLGGTGVVTIPWLAFCSGPYLKHDGRQIPLPSSDYWSYALRYSDNTTVFADGLGLPTTVDCYTAQGQPVCQYRVSGSTNVLGWSFPIQFHLAQYRRKDYPSSAWELNWTADGKLVHIKVGRPPHIPTEAQTAVER